MPRPPPKARWFVLPLVVAAALVGRPEVERVARATPETSGVVFAARLPEVRPPEAPALSKHWFRGNLHMHSLWSDGTDPPEVAVAWYRDNGYHFVALTEHNMVPDVALWRPTHLLPRLGRESIRHYRGMPNAPRFETRQGERGLELLLAPISQLRKDFDRADEFLVLAGEEITGAHGARPVHLNAVHLEKAVQPESGRTVADAMNATLERIRVQEKAQGFEALRVINHPNFSWAFTPSHLAQAREAEFVEIMNGNPYTKSQGNAVHPAVEHAWDVANALRLVRYGYPPLQGLAVDDMHRTRGEGSLPGRAWTMVLSERLDADLLVRALKQGDFYASTGVSLTDISFDEAERTLSVRVLAEDDLDYSIDFVGVVDDPKLKAKLAQVEHSPALAGALISRLLERVRGREASYRMRGDELFVRAVVTSSRSPRSSSFHGQKEQAWTPVFGWKPRASLAATAKLARAGATSP